jgi:hypothetical protein
MVSKALASLDAWLVEAERVLEEQRQITSADHGDGSPADQQGQDSEDPEQRYGRVSALR